MINSLRHHEIFDPHSPEAVSHHILIVGAGAIGSRCFEALVSTGLTNLSLIDFDIVEDHNIPNQLFTREHLGMAKVDACNQWATSKAGADATEKMRFINDKIELGQAPEKYFENMTYFPTIVISAVDSFESRRIVHDFADSCLSEFFIDGRMASAQAISFAHEMDNSDQIDAWAATLGDDNDTDSPLSVGTTAAIAGNVMAQQCLNYIKGGYYEPALRIMTAPWEMMRRYNMGEG